MSWVHLADGRLSYTARFAPPKTFDSWSEGGGRGLVDGLAQRKRFALFGKARAARKDLWAMVRYAAERPPLADALATAVSAYLPSLGEMAVLPVDLPRITVALRRVAIVPRVVCNATALDYVSFAFDRAVFDVPEGGDALREYLAMELLSAMDEAVLAAATSGRQPIRTAGDWVIIDADRQFSWWVPLSGDATRDWRGHYVLYEAPQGKLTRAARSDLSSKIKALSERLPAISRHQRNEIVTQARARMREATSKAFARAAV
jgi:hypothetical protein